MAGVQPERHLIDASGEFSGTLYVPDDVASSTHYGVVAVIGCQSGGKSTLLNAAFGTKFPVLDASARGRGRTTVGIWGSIATATTISSANSVPLVVLDVEGADSRERGDGARSFESRTALFALALADVVVVNMWAHDIGRYSAANYELFETVFAHAALLRSTNTNNSRMRILVAIRDHDGETELGQIRRVLMGDLAAIWEKLRVRKNVSFDDLFEFRFVTLPHLKYAREAFDEKVIQLRQVVSTLVKSRIADTIDFRAPLAAFDALSAAVWADVNSATGGTEFSLDVPKHAALAAHYSLGRTVDSVLQNSVAPLTNALREELELDWRKPLENFAGRVRDIVEKGLAEFDQLAKPVREADGGAEAAQIRRREIGQNLVQHVSQLRERYLWVARDSTMTAFEEEFGPLSASDSGYLRQARRIATKFIRIYRDLYEEARYPQVLEPYLEERDIVASGVDGYGSDPPSDEALALLSDNTGNNNSVQDGPLLVSSLEPPMNARMQAIRALEIDSDSEDGDEFAVDRFMKDVHRMVEEKRRLGEAVIVPTNTPQGPPWWKGIMMRGLMLFINYMQARQHHLANVRAQKKHEEDFPPVPTF